jgi:signal transduction histidine kinase
MSLFRQSLTILASISGVLLLIVVISGTIQQQMLRQVIDSTTINETMPASEQLEAVRTDLTQLATSFNNFAILRIIGIIISFGLIFYIVHKRLIEPIREVTNTAIRYSQGDFTVYFFARSAGEIATLGRELNQMAQNMVFMLDEADEMAREARAGSEFKTSLIARVSHELRTPLGAISGLSEMLTSGALGDLTAPQAETVGRIQRNATQLNKMVNDMLLQSRLEAGEAGKLRTEVTSPATLIRHITDIHEPIARKKGLKLQLDISSRLSPLVRTDISKLEMVVSNLVGNAIKYTESGTVQISAASIGKDQWQFQVKDTGIGIPEERQQEVFEPFRQGDESFTRKYGGIGLGLSIVKAYVQQMNGTIAVESDIGKGSTFTLTFPTEIHDTLSRKELAKALAQ